MTTFEITLQRKLSDYWPIMLTWQAEGLEVQRDEKLYLDFEELRSQPTPLHYGTYLGQALFQGTIRDSFNQAWSQSDNDNPLQIWLTVDDPELKPLPWQRLCFPLDGQWDYLCLYQNIVFSRYITSQSSAPFPPIGRQDMRALVVVANPANLAQYHLAPFDAPAIVTEIKNALGDIPHDVLTNPSLKGLLEQLTQQRYTLLHWVSHGTYNDKKQDTVLYLSDESPILARDLILQLRRMAKQPYFIFLSACESAATRQSTEAIDGFAQRLVHELGIPAVLGMDDLISIVTARQLATQFYRQLRLQTTPRIYVDRVFAAALAGLSRQTDITIPTLYHRLGSRPLFDDSWDKPLTPTEIAAGLAKLPHLIAERAPVLQPHFDAASATLTRLNQTDRQALTPADKVAQAQALQNLNELCMEVCDMGFNALALGHTPPAYDNRCPFLGLQAFSRNEAHWFFGRSELIQQLQEHLASRQGLVVLGQSGSGKSSLVLAGLIPHLQRQTPDLQLVYVIPKHNPREQLATALQSVTSPAKILVVDQFEEVFTLCNQEAERQEFFNQLLALAQQLPLILTMRVDFLGDCASYPDLNHFMERCLKNIGPMSHEELYEAMQQQAQAVNLHFEAVLSEMILEEVQSEPGKMPLLQYALRVLWQRRHGRWLCLTEYEKLGRIKKAIASTADEIYQKLTPSEQSQLRAIFIRLTHLGQLDGAGYRDSRQRVPLPELVTHDLQSTRALVHRLVNERLLMTSVDAASEVEYVEVVHEALIHHWEKLRQWLQSNRTALELRQQLTQDAREWHEGQRVDSLLPRWNSKLEAALTLKTHDNLTLNQLERDYLQACVTLRDKEAAEKEAQRQRELAQAQALAAEQRRRLQWAMGLSVLVALAALLALWFGVQSRQNAQTAQNNAATAEANAVVANARRLLAQSKEIFEEKPLLGIRLALESEGIAPPGMKNEVYTVLQEQLERGYVTKLGQDITEIYTTPLTNTILVVYPHQPSVLQNMRTGQVVITLSGIVKSISYSPENNGTFIIDYNDSQSQLWLLYGQKVITLNGKIMYDRWYSQKIYYSSENNSNFVVGYEGLPGELWLQHGNKVITLTDEIVHVSYSPQGNGDFVVWYKNMPDELRLRNGQEVITLNKKSLNAFYSPENNGDLVMVYNDTPAELWLKYGQKVITLSGIIGYDHQLSYSPQGNGDFIVWYMDLSGELRLQHGQQIITLSKNIDYMHYSSKNSGDIVIKYKNAPSELWLKSGQYITLSGKVNQFLNYGFEGNSDFVVSYENMPGELRLRDGKLVTVLNGNIKKVLYSPENNGDFVVSYENVPSELRLRQYQKIITLSGKVKDISYSPKNNGDFIASYEGVPGELRLQHGQQVITLSPKISTVDYSSQGTYFLVNYENNTTEVWQGKEARLLTQLGLGLVNHVFDESTHSLVTWYKDGRAYLLDLATLNAIQPEANLDKLIQIGCDTLQRNKAWFKEEEIELYLFEVEGRACK